MSIRFEMKGRIDQDGRRIRFEAAGAWRPPDAIRLEIRGPVGGVRSLVAVRGDRMRVLYPAERRYFEAQDSPDSWERLMGLPLTSRQMGSLFFPDGDGERSAADRLAARGWQVTVRGRKTVLVPGLPAAGGFERIELVALRVEEVASASLPDSLFDVSVPAGWLPIDPPGLHEAPLLVP